jgi:hypothetical protein
VYLASPFSSSSKHGFIVTIHVSMEKVVSRPERTPTIDSM